MVNEIFLAVIIILPGFLSLQIIRKISIYEEKLPDQVYYFWSLILSIILFSIFSSYYKITSFDGIEKLIFDYEKLSFLYLGSIILGLVLGLISLYVSHRGYQPVAGEVWSIALKRLNKDEGKFITIFTSDSLEFSGKVRLYHEDAPREILIEDPIQIIRNKEMEAIDELEWGKEILFTEDDIKRIVFYESTKNHP